MTLIPDLQRNLIDAAKRRRTTRRRLRSALALTVLVAGLAIVAIALGRSDDAASPGAANRTGSLPPPPRHLQPVAGTFSEPVAFSFDGVRYRMVGYRARGGVRERGRVVCIRLARPDGDARFPRPTLTCAGERSLRRGLKRDPVLNVGGGGGFHYTVGGFTRAETSRVAVTGTRRPSHVALSDPWRPMPGTPVRAFVAVVAQPGGGGEVPRRPFLGIRVVAAP